MTESEVRAVARGLWSGSSEMKVFKCGLNDAIGRAECAMVVPYRVPISRLTHNKSMFADW